MPPDRLLAEPRAEGLQPAELHQALKTRHAFLPGDGVEIREEFEVFFDGQFAIEAETLGDVTGQRGDGFCLASKIERPDAAFAGVGLENAEHQAHGGGLAGAVRSDQAEEFAGLDVEGEMIDGGDGPKVRVRLLMERRGGIGQGGSPPQQEEGWLRDQEKVAKQP